MTDGTDSRTPFPTEMPHDRTSAFYESVSADGTTSMYVVISATAFMTERHRQLLENGVELVHLYPALKHIDRPPTDDDHWLYSVRSFEVAREHHDDEDAFANNKQHFKRADFARFDAAMTYCMEQFGIGWRDFRKKSQTNHC